MNSQLSRTLQEAVTTASPDEVIQAAKTFFARRNGIYSAFLEREGPGWVNFRGQGGEEIVIAAVGVEGGTRVSGSTYLFDQQVARFLSTLPAKVSMVESGVAETAGV
ncbi:MAG TPA: hypothetical protein VF042_14895 [Gemmatimonadaceae bacterium]